MRLLKIVILLTKQLKCSSILKEFDVDDPDNIKLKNFIYKMIMIYCINNDNSE